MTIQQIANAYPERVGVLFTEYGINKTVNGENLLSAYLIYGESFLNALVDDIDKNANFFLGGLGDKIKGAFSKAKTSMQKVDWGKASKNGSKFLQIVSGMFGTNTDEQLQKEVEPPKNDKKILLYGGLGLGTLILIIVLVKFL